jgi:hypothetical protein
MHCVVKDKSAIATILLLHDRKGESNEEKRIVEEQTTSKIIMYARGKVKERKKKHRTIDEL